MNESKFYSTLINKFKTIVTDNNLMDESVKISGKTLTAEEAIGNPTRDDYPILKGKEMLMQAEFKGSKGQAFTDMPGGFNGTIGEILANPLSTNYDLAMLISTLNAVLRHLGIAEKTVHCKDNEPEICSKQLVEHIQEKHGNPKVALIGLQPAMLEHLSKHLSVRTADLDLDHIGSVKHGVEIEDGNIMTDEILDWCDLIVATGSTVANGSITLFIGKKPVIFFGTTAAGPAALMNLPRFCACAS